MKFTALAVLALSCVSSAFASSASIHHAARRDHHGRALERRDATTTHLGKRYDGARMTFYSTGLGACGQTNSDSDYIVALNSDQYGSGGDCFKTITITYNGKSTQAQVVDECPGCPYGGLDLSPGLFSFFASQDDGVIYGSWVFGSGGGGDDPASSSSSSKKPKSTSTWTPEPTSTWTPDPTTSSTWSPEPSTSSSTWSSSSSSTWSTSWSSSSSSAWPSSSSSAWSSSSAAVPSATPSAEAVTTDDSALDALYVAVVQLGGVIGAGAQANLQASQ